MFQSTLGRIAGRFDREHAVILVGGDLNWVGFQAFDVWGQRQRQCQRPGESVGPLDGNLDVNLLTLLDGPFARHRSGQCCGVLLDIDDDRC